MLRCFMAVSRKRPPEPAMAKPLTARAYQAIKNEIISNRLKPGDPISPDHLVRELKLSKTPVREAMLQLAQEGFIEIRPRMGTFVSHLDLRQIQEMYEVRRLVESYAAKLAADLVPGSVIKAVRNDLLGLNAEGNRVDAKALSEAGYKLHRVIVENCGNRVLAQSIFALQDHFARFRSLSLQIPEKVISSHAEHIRIAEALCARDGKLAERLVRGHFDHAARSLVDGLLKRSAEGSARLTVSV